MPMSTSVLQLEQITQLQALLAQIAHGASPFGPPPTGIVRRAHTSAMPDVMRLEREPPSPPAWPDVPLAAGRRLTGVQVSRAILAIATDEAIAGGAGGAGLTLARLRTALQNAGFDSANVGRAAPALALWLACAGVLAAPGDTERPWAAPRPLTGTNIDEIREALRANSPPTPEAVTAERDRGLR